MALADWRSALEAQEQELRATLNLAGIDYQATLERAEILHRLGFVEPGSTGFVAPARRDPDLVRRVFGCDNPPRMAYCLAVEILGNPVPLVSEPIQPIILREPRAEFWGEDATPAPTWCPGCDPGRDLTREVLDLRWCPAHQPTMDGVDDARATTAFGATTDEGAIQRAMCAQIHRGPA